MRRFPTMQDFKATVPPGGLLNPGLREGGGVGVNFNKIKSSCPTPGLKIRSRGMGRGLGRGMGRGPVGRPFGR